MRVSVLCIAVRWALTSEDTGNMKTGRREDSRWRRGTCPNKVRKKAGTDCSMSEVSFHCEELSLGVVFSIGKFHSSSLHILQLNLICPIPVYISDYPRVFEVNQGVVNKEATSG